MIFPVFIGPNEQFKVLLRVNLLEESEDCFLLAQDAEVHIPVTIWKKDEIVEEFEKEDLKEEEK